MTIKELRMQRGWPQEYLSELTGLSVRTIQRIEKGSPAGLESRKALAAVFELPLVEMKSMLSNESTADAFESEKMPMLMCQSLKKSIVFFAENVRGYSVASVNI